MDPFSVKNLWVSYLLSTVTSLAFSERYPKAQFENACQRVIGQSSQTILFAKGLKSHNKLESSWSYIFNLFVRFFRSGDFVKIGILRCSLRVLFGPNQNQTWSLLFER